MGLFFYFQQDEMRFLTFPDIALMHIAVPFIQERSFCDDFILAVFQFHPASYNLSPVCCYQIPWGWGGLAYEKVAGVGGVGGFVGGARRLTHGCLGRNVSIVSRQDFFYKSLSVRATHTMPNKHHYPGSQRVIFS